MDSNIAVAYARYSSDNQSDESIDGQLRAIRKYAEANNIIIISEYIDRAKSATSAKRPAFQKMLADAKLKNFDIVIVHKLDRFSRDKYDFAVSRRLLKNNNVKLVSILENLDDTPEAIILESLLEGMAQYYSANLSREVKKTMKEHALQGKHMGGIPPLGFDVDPLTKQYVLHEQEALVVKLIFQLYLDGHGYMSIIETLNSKEYKTKKGGAFGKNSLHEILKNEKYTGTLVYNRAAAKNTYGKRNNHRNKSDDEIIRLEGKIPIIISKEDFQKVQEKMRKNKKKAGSYKAKHIYLLSGLIYCGECGQAMAGNVKYSKSHIYNSYRCNNRERTKKCCNKEIRTTHLEKYVLHKMGELFDEKNIPKILAEINSKYYSIEETNKQEIAHLNAVLSQTEKEIENILLAIKQGIFHKLINEELTLLEEKQARIKEEIKQLSFKPQAPQVTEDCLRSVFAEAKKIIKTSSIPEMKKLMAQYIERVEVYEDYVRVVFIVYILVMDLNGGGGSYRAVTGIIRGSAMAKKIPI